MRKQLTAWILPAAALLMPLADARGQARIGVEGHITAVQGTRLELFDGLVKIEAAGARIDTEDPAFKNISDLRPGTFIEVEAVVDAAGTLRATLVEVSEEKDPKPELSGVIESFDTAAQTFAIGGISIHLTSGTKFKDLSAIRTGIKVEVVVRFSGGRLTAEFVERDE